MSNIGLAPVKQNSSAAKWTLGHAEIVVIIMPLVMLCYAYPVHFGVSVTQIFERTPQNTKQAVGSVRRGVLGERGSGLELLA